MTDLKERLLAYRSFDEWGDVIHPICDEAARTLEAYEREIADQLETLRLIVGNANEAMPLGPFDCIDNTGAPYQSQAFQQALERGRKLLAKASLPHGDK